MKSSSRKERDTSIPIYPSHVGSHGVILRPVLNAPHARQDDPGVARRGKTRYGYVYVCRCVYTCRLASGYFLLQVTRLSARIVDEVEIDRQIETERERESSYRRKISLLFLSEIGRSKKTSYVVCKITNKNICNFVKVSWKMFSKINLLNNKLL